MKRPVAVSTWGPPQKDFASFLATAKKHDIEPQNADPETWPGAMWNEREWFRKSQAQARFVQEHANEFTHILFCDSYDVIFATGWNEILRKFEALDSPIVFGTECNPWPDPAQASLYPETPHRCRFLNAGFWIASAEAAIPFTQALAEIAGRREKCDQGIVVDMFLSGKWPIKLDTACSLCFCMNLDSPNFLDVSGPRPITTDTKEQPCMFHGNGGSSLASVIACLNK